jgi:hypothetical protein
VKVKGCSSAESATSVRPAAQSNDEFGRQALDVDLPSSFEPNRASSFTASLSSIRLSTASSPKRLAPQISSLVYDALAKAGGERPHGHLVLGPTDDALEKAAESTTALGSAQPTFARIHTNADAARAAAALDAAAFTVGNDIFFASGRYQPSTRRGQRLISHELAHVSQFALGAPPAVIRRRSIFEEAGIFLGLTEGDFEDKELLDYLKLVDRTQKIEDHYDSDNKARAIVRHWLRGQAQFRLNANQMVLLIEEMDSGYVGSADQEGIFSLLSHATNGDLRIIFGAGGVSARQLESDFGGDRRKNLLAFYDMRFKGGRAALYGGTVDPVGILTPTSNFPWNFDAFRKRLESPAYRDDELAAELSALSDADRNAAFEDLGNTRARLQNEVIDLTDKHAAETDPVKKADLLDKAMRIARLRQRYDAILQPAFRGIATTEAAGVMLTKTHAPSATEKHDIATALVPQVGSSPGSHTFVEQVHGETKKYGDKIKELMPTMVQRYYNDMVVGKGSAEHADPSKVHQLAEFDSIANAAKDATDGIYSPYVLGTHPAFRSDQPPPVGRGQLHDLFADTESELAAMGPAAKRGKARALLGYFFQNDDDIAAIDRQHEAAPRFNEHGVAVNAEAKILDKAANDWLATSAHVKQLNEIDRNWDASADPATHEVNLQIFKKDTAEKDRWFLWDMFQTLIHEYIHTLADPLYVAFADRFGPGQENTTLIEGVDSLLTEIVWSKAKDRTADPGLRAQVEGPAYSGLPFDASVIPPVYNRRYGSYAQAIKLVSVVGIRNLYAAYFMGRVDLIRPS